jgi:hypothetical protein
MKARSTVDTGLMAVAFQEPTFSFRFLILTLAGIAPVLGTPQCGFFA